jgi:hypothetical protein
MWLILLFLKLICSYSNPLPGPNPQQSTLLRYAFVRSKCRLVRVAYMYKPCNFVSEVISTNFQWRSAELCPLFSFDLDRV